MDIFKLKVAVTLLSGSLLLSGCGGGGSADFAAGNSVALPAGTSLGTVDSLVAATQGSTLINPTPIGAGAQCAAGGTRVDSGIDANGNGVLDATEVAATAYVCNGLPGANGAVGASGATGATGTTGSAGSAGSAGAAGNAGATGATGANGAAGPTGAAGNTGATGLTTLLLTTPEPVGANCAAGGVKVQAGTDADRNGVLAVGEVTTTSFVCNGINGVNGVGGAGKNWQTAARVAAGGDSQVAFEASGKALSLLNNGGSLSATSYTQATGWSALQQINTTGIVSKFSFAVNPQGTAIAVWQQFTAGNTKMQLWASRREGGVWRAPARINTGADTDALDIAVAINASGDVTAIWYEKALDGKINVQARRYQVFVSAWDASITTLQADTAMFTSQVYGLSVAMDDTSAAIAAYTREGGNAVLIDTRRYNPATGWASFELAGLFTCFDKLCSAPKVRMNNIGQAMLVWAGNAMPGNVGVVRRAVFASRYSAGSWDNGVGLRSGVYNTTGAVLTPDVAFDAAGNAVAVWSEYDTSSNRTSVYTSRFSPPPPGPLSFAQWRASEVISASGNIYQTKVAFDGSGNAQAVWAQEDAAQMSSIWSNRFSTSTAWGIATRIHTEPLGDASAPQVAADPTNGNMLAMWFLSGVGGVPSGVWANFLR